MPDAVHDERERSRPEELTDLEGLLDRIEQAEAVEDRVTLGGIIDSIGHRSFGPLLLVPGLVTVAPLIGDIPGVPTLMAVLVWLTTGQLLVGRESLWLPGWLRERSVASDTLSTAIGRVRPVARVIDRWTGPRLTFLVGGPGTYVIVVVCLAIAVAMPPMELIPFSATGAGIALTVFGVSLLARDGLLAVIGLTVTAGTFGLVLYQLAF
jgi:hypothetical protein